MEMNYHNLVMRTIKQLACLGLLLIASSTAQAELLQGFSAEYKGYRWGRELGEAHMQLDALGRQRYKLTYTSEASFFFLSDKRSEISLFEYKNGQILPYKYNFKRSGTGKNKSMQVQFDHRAKQIQIKDKESIALTDQLDNQIYRLALQKQLAQGKEQFEYNLINDRGLARTYKMKVLGKEQLKLPYGMLEGVKVKMVRENNKRETFAWFAPSLNYLMVRLQQFKDGDEQIDIRLSEYSPTIRQ